MGAGLLIRIAAVALFGAASYNPADDYAVLNRRHLGLPIAGLKVSDIRDTFNEGRANGKPHEASDILAPRGTPVLAMQDGTIQRLFTSVPGGLTVYQFDPEKIYCYYYAHLDRYAEGLRGGQIVKRGDVIGYVGTTGNAPANTPHLHLAIFKIGPEKRWWQGVAINPYPILRRLAEESGGSGGNRGKARLVAPPVPPHLQAVQVDVDHRRGVERQ